MDVVYGLRLSIPISFMDRTPRLTEPSSALPLVWMMVMLGGRGRSTVGLSCFFLFLLVPDFSLLISFLPLLPCLQGRPPLLSVSDSPPTLFSEADTLKPFLHSRGFGLSSSNLCLVSWLFLFTFWR